MAEGKTGFQSIYGDDENEFEIEDISDETLNMPTNEIRAARKNEIENEIEGEIAAEAQEETTDRASEADSKPAAAEDDVAAIPSDVEDVWIASEESKGRSGGSMAEDPSGRVLEDEEPGSYYDEDMEGVLFEEHDARGSGRERRDAAYQESGRENDAFDPDEMENADEDEISILSYIAHAVLFTIPVVGTVLMLVYIISDSKNSHLRHFAQIWLVTLVIVAIGLVVAAYMLGIA